jgi:hypothetical protein
MALLEFSILESEGGIINEEIFKGKTKQSFDMNKNEVVNILFKIKSEEEEEENVLEKFETTFILDSISIKQSKE